MVANPAGRWRPLSVIGCVGFFQPDPTYPSSSRDPSVQMAFPLFTHSFAAPRDLPSLPTATLPEKTLNFP